MASIFDIPLRESGGPTALAAFEYQHRIAVGELLRLATSTECDLIEFDSHDDILVRAKDGAGFVAEFVQVKAQASCNWTPSALYSDDKDSRPTAGKSASSLVARQLNRAIGDDDVVFRVVTRFEVNHDLAVLKQPSTARDQNAVKKLKDNLVPRFAHLTFPKDRTVGDWIDKMCWRVAGPEQAVDDRNLRTIAEAVFSQFARTLTPAQVREIYLRLLSHARQAALILEPRDQKGCTRTQLIMWLSESCAQLPIHLPPDVHTILDSLQREAHERCVARWLNAGVAPQLAQELAADKAVGADAVRWLQGQPEDFVWVNGTFGAGKSLAVDRHFQQALCDYRDGKQARLPVFLQAKTLIRPLGEEIATRAEALGDYYRQGVYAVIDGADECTQQEGRQLVQEAASYVRAHPGSKVLITSTFLEVSGQQPKTLPQLSKTEADALLRRLTGKQAFGFPILSDGRFGADFANPFFIILCARFGTGLCRAELVRRMVAAALEHVENAIQPVEELLAHLAQWQFDHGSALVPERELGPSQVALTSVLQTRLLERRGDFLSFSLECVAHWFAAQAIERGLVSMSDLLKDTARLERWQFALAMVLNRAEAELTDRIMRHLAETQPAFASLVLHDGLLNWGFSQPTRQVAAEEVGRNLREAMLAWKTGLEPVSDSMDFFPVNDRRELLKIAASSNNGRFDVIWHDDPDLPCVSARQSVAWKARPRERTVYWGSTVLDHPAWAWKTTHGFLARDLNKVTNEYSLAAANERLHREIAWAAGCYLLRESGIRCGRLSVAKLTEMLAVGLRWTTQRCLLETFVNDVLIPRGSEMFDAPYPQSDAEPQGSWMWQFFSHERMTERAVSVYQTALVAYREVVELVFPKMAARFPHYAAWPFDCVGVVTLHGNEGRGGYVLHWAMESLPAGQVGQAHFSSGFEEDAALFQKDWLEMRALRDVSKPTWHLQSWGSSALTLWGDNPAASIVKGWIESDLRAVGWL